MTQTVMRSNNAFILLPYNFFEFSLLGEMVAAALRVELGQYMHYAASMHIFARDIDAAAQIGNTTPAPSVPMPPMPFDPGPLEQAVALARYEPTIRTATSVGEVLATLDQARSELHEYWWSMLAVLAIYKFQKLDAAPDDYVGVANECMGWLAPYLSDVVPRPSPTTDQLFTDERQGITNSAELLAVAEQRVLRRDLARLSAQLTSENGPVKVSDIERMSEIAAKEQRFALAARDGESLTVEDIRELLTQARAGE